MQLLEATLSDPGGTALVKARAVRVARAPLGAGTLSRRLRPVRTAPTWPRPGPRSLPGGAVELRYVEGAPAQLGPRTAWFRLKVPVIAGEQPTPLQRLLVAADFPNGISNELDWNEWIFINPDLTVYVEREPRSEWSRCGRTRASSRAKRHSRRATLFDTEGRIGRSLQSLYIAPAPGRAG